MIFLIFVLLLSGLTLYRRYFPVGNATFKQSEHDVLLDVRDYHIVYKDVISGAITLPYGYLKRYYREIPQKNVIVIAENKLEKNLAIRFLKQKGYHVKGYILKNDRNFCRGNDLKNVCNS